MKCKSCGIPFIDHLGIIGTCKMYQDALIEIESLKNKINRLNEEVKCLKKP